ncbi:hypothetical protein EPN54_01585 [bacterium]|nr:MAG: hypothetical protein EPN54_01585 [bacterium]
MLKKFFLSLVFLFASVMLSFIPSLFADETITITTYYPSPYGSYQDLYVANKLGIGTTSPTYKLTVQTAVGSWGIVQTDGTRMVGLFVDANAGYLGTRSNDNLEFFTNNGAAQMTLLTNGNVGIGTTAPTAQFERACPAGFTNVKAGNNQLGCMQTALQGSGTWWTAANTCFTTYGARLAIYSEWYVALNNYSAIARPTGWEWLGNGDYYSTEGCSMVGSGGSITNPDTWPCSQTANYRCWLPR